MSKRKLVLGPIDSYDEFKEEFKKMFNIDWKEWSENAEQDNSAEIAEWNDGKIFAGISIYDGRVKVYV